MTHQELQEVVACCIYESMFLGKFMDVSGVERELYLQTARAVIALLGGSERHVPVCRCWRCGQAWGEANNG